MSMAKAEKDLEPQYRKNLMIVASIVLIYSIAGGKMAAEFSMFGAKLQFNRPELVEYAMVLVMCFFWWRHWQISGDARKEHTRKKYYYMILNAALFDRLIASKNEATSVLYEPNEWSRIFGVPIDLLIDHTKKELYWKRKPFFGGDLAYIELSSGEDSDAFPFVEREIEISWWMRMPMMCSYIKAFFIASIRDTEFGDAVLPSFISLLALVFWCINRFAVSSPQWQSELCADLFNRL